MTGAALFRLVHPTKVRVGEHCAYIVTAVAVNHDDTSRLNAARLSQYVVEQRLAAERLQHLGQRRVHPLALAGGEDDYGWPQRLARFRKRFGQLSARGRDLHGSRTVRDGLLGFLHRL